MLQRSQENGVPAVWVCQSMSGALKSPRITALELLWRLEREFRVSRWYSVEQFGGIYRHAKVSLGEIFMFTVIISIVSLVKQICEGIDSLTAIKTPPPRLILSLR